ncbi:hypothetical protein LOTGIDRAFT_158381 [Lottia gigantea]|uniref:Uncharacterized protein n=1 Tax=Lottia gigantea TaxID=225164 RepID=V4AQ03_LOTGI|nr:hypothetical protein LOTGIDRAFT_158381 [Lottia gigantea]ESO99302.1 hypothetical protein LOTGIDRAFT_158381 [Lottia gigantea]
MADDKVKNNLRSNSSINNELDWEDLEFTLLSTDPPLTTGLKNIRDEQAQQAARLVKLEGMSCEYDDEYYDFEDGPDDRPQAKECLNDEDELSDIGGSPGLLKRKVEESPAQTSNHTTTENCFSSMSKRIKPSDSIVDKTVDEVLANNINELFRQGMSDDQYDALIKDEATDRPTNCDALVTAKTNQLVWDIKNIR